ncbi:TBC1 domain family member 14 [Hydra vulgaris]|uniref:TBC1 domain family member 14 n=1 Tax=Hydra vulgaris TaxID=6087 RepID=A0ABM4BGW3_HYDVU
MNSSSEEQNSLVTKLSNSLEIKDEKFNQIRNSSITYKPLSNSSVKTCNGFYADYDSVTSTLDHSHQKTLSHNSLTDKKVHLFPNVLVNPPVEPYEIDSDEEDFRLSHRKNDSGNGSSVGSSSLHSQPCVEYNLSTEHESDNNIKFCLEDMDILRSSSQSYNKNNKFSNPKIFDNSKNQSDNKFMDVPLNNLEKSNHELEKTNLNTFAPKVKFEPLAVNDPLRPPPATDLQPKTRLLSKPKRKSWHIFGNIAIPVPKSPSQIRSEKNTNLVTSTTALILEHRPSCLPPKTPKEEQMHNELYAEIVESARRKELRDLQLQKKKMNERKKLEEQLSNLVKQWKEDFIPNWQTCYKSKKVRDIWSQGIPPSVRGIVWKLAIGNELHISTELFNIYHTNAEQRMKNINDPIMLDNIHHHSENSVIVSKENTLALIMLDVARTFPSLGIFQKGGPYHETLKHLLAAYTCHRPDIGYAQGMSFVAAMLLLNMDLQDAFIAFANLLNRPCQMAFYTVNQQMMSAYFKTFDVVLADQIPRLHYHFKQECLSHDIYLLDWIFTMYSKSLPLDTACRVWDLFFRDGEEFLFKTALGVLLMHEETLLEMEFFRLATYLTKLSNTLAADELFVFIDKISFPSQKYHSTLSQMIELS